jgi:hypothetical protein
LIWAGLKAVLGNTGGGAVYGDVTLISMLVRASEGLSPDAATRITVDCTRKLDGTATSNPALAFEDIWTDAAYGAGRSSAALDTTALAAWESSVSGHNGFNGRFDTSTSLWEAMQLIARTTDRFPVPLGSQISIAHDGTKSTPAMSLVGPLISAVRLSYSFDGPDEPDRIEVEYRLPTTGKEAFVRYPADAVAPERVVLFGCTDATTAATAAEGLWLRKRYRRRAVQFSAELEGHLLEIGSLVSLDHPVCGAVDVVIQSVQAVDEHHTEVSAFVYDARAYA